MSASINPMLVGVMPYHTGDPGGFRALPMPTGAWSGNAYNLSADGNVVVGQIVQIPHGLAVACYWPRTDQPPILINSEYLNTYAQDCNFNGSKILVNTINQAYGSFMWTASGGLASFVGTEEFPVAMTPDGKRIVGGFTYTHVSGAPRAQACYWNEFGIMTVLGFLPGHNVSQATAVSADGRYIVGYSENFIPGVGIGSTQRAFRWTAEGGMVDLGKTPSSTGSRAFGVSNDGTLVCGDLNVGGILACQWTLTGGLAIPPVLVPGGNSSTTCVSGDGTTMVGYAGIPYPGPTGEYFAYWTSAGITIPDPVQLDPDDPFLDDIENQTYPSAVSHDGRTFVGYTQGRGSHYLPWIYVIAARCLPPLPIDAVGADVVPATITPWFLEPDWANGVTERLLWKTNIITSQTGIEQRRRLRNAPRRQIEAQFTLIDQDRRAFDSLMNGPATHGWNYPLWWEKYALINPASVDDLVIYVEDMTGSEVTSGDVLLFRGASPFVMEIVTVLTVNPGIIELKLPLTREWPQGAHFYLTRLCRLTGQQRNSRRADDAAQVTLTFESIEPNEYASITPPEIGLDYPVLEITPDEAQDMSFEYKRLVQEFDNEVVSTPVRRDLAGVSFMLQQFTYFTYGRRELADLRGLLYYLQGKLVPLYVPTYSRDVDLLPLFHAEPGTTHMAVVRSGYTEYVTAATQTRRLLMFVFRDGTTLIHTVASSSIVSDGQETLTVVEPFYRAINNTLLSRICWLALSRQDQDEISILHHADSRGPTTLTTTFATLIAGRNATPYNVDVWNGSYEQLPTEPVPSPPDGPVPAPVINPVPLVEGDVGGSTPGEQKGSDGGPAGDSQSAGFG